MRTVPAERSRSTSGVMPEGPGVVLLNKPYGVLCQFSRDGSGKPTLADFVPVPDVYPAGRLDADSEGLVVLTADGALQARIANPRHRLVKTYRAQVDGVPSPAQLAALARGVDLGDFVTAPARARHSRAGGAVAEDAADPGSQGPADVLDRNRAHRRPQSAGAPDDRGGRTSDVAPDPVRCRSVVDRRSRAGRLAPRGRAAPRAMIAPRSMTLFESGVRRRSPSIPLDSRTALAMAPLPLPKAAISLSAR